MKIDVEIGFGSRECKVSIDGTDVSNRLKEISINKAGGCIPEVIMKFAPDECNVNVESQFITIDRGLSKYSIDELTEEMCKKLTKNDIRCLI